MIEQEIQAPVATNGHNGQSATSDPFMESAGHLKSSLSDLGDSFLKRYVEEIEKPVRTTINCAAEAHHVAAELFRTSAQGLAAGDHFGFFDLVTVYLEKCNAEVINPLHGVVREIDKKDNQLLESAVLMVPAILNKAPEQVSRSTPPDLFSAATGSSHGFKTKRFFKRLGGSFSSDKARQQEIPMRRIAGRRLPAYLQSLKLASNGFCEGLCHFTAALELAVSRWSGAMLQVDAAMWAEASPDAEDVAPDATNERPSQIAPILAAVEEFESFLQASLDPGLHIDLTEQVKGAIARAWSDISIDINNVGLDPALNQDAESFDFSSIQASSGNYDSWQKQVANRLSATAGLLSLRIKIARFATETAQTIHRDSLGAIDRASDSYAKLLDTLETESLPAIQQSQSLDALRSRIVKMKEELESTTSQLKQHGGRQLKKATTISEDGLKRIDQIIASLPKELELHPVAGDGRYHPELIRQQVVMRPMDMARKSFDAIAMERIRSSTELLAAPLQTGASQLGNAIDVLSFSFTQALADLDQGEDSDEEVHKNTAQELVENGLRDARESLIGLKDLTSGAAVTFRQSLLTHGGKSLLRMFQRINANDAFRDQMLDIRDSMSIRWQLFTESLALSLSEARGDLEKWWRILRRKASALVRFSRSAVEGELANDAAAVESIAALSGLEELLKDLPVVYRRLFSLEPVSEAGLLCGRETDVVVVGRNYERWKSGLSNPIVLTGIRGCGQTSLLNALEQTLFAEQEVVRIQIQERLSNAVDFAALISKAFEITIPEDTEDPIAFLMEVINDESSPKRICFLEHLEQMNLRDLGDNLLTTSVMTFLSGTDSQVFWLCTATHHDWQVISKSNPVAAGLAISHPLSELSREALEALIFTRHDKSGLSVIFEEPSNLGPLVSRKLSRMDDPEESQALLRAEWFDRLHRSNPHAMLALFYWLRAARVDEEERVIRIAPFKPLSFAFLKEFQMDEAFTLKAFLEHDTLTLEEHDRIFSCSRTRSLKIFESLHNHHLIASASNEDNGILADMEPVSEGKRYRVRPLIVPPVLTYLKEKHIAY